MCCINFTTEFQLGKLLQSTLPAGNASCGLVWPLDSVTLLKLLLSGLLKSCHMVMFQAKMKQACVLSEF